MRVWELVVSNSKIYWLLRAYSILLGIMLFSFSMDIIFQKGMAPLLYDDVPTPAISMRFVDALPILIYGIIILFPNRWSLKKPIFYSRILIMSLGALVIILSLAWTIKIFIGGQIVLYELIIIFPFFLSFGAIPPLTLIMKKRLAEKED